jgi:long-chain acyl-CoA synthetase
LGALAVLNPEHWAILAGELHLHPYERASLDDPLIHHIVLDRIAQQLHGFPGHIQIRRVCLTLEPWTIENGLITSTLKVRRERLLKHYSAEVAALYEGRELSPVAERWETPEDEHA